MKEFKAHPLAELLPMMSEAEFISLRSDIDQNGQTDPIELFEGKILDGRNRYRAICELKKDFGRNIEPKLRDFKGDHAAAVALVYSRANHRNMTDSQKAAAAVNFLPHFEKLARERQTASLKQGSRPGTSSGTGEAREFAGGLFGVSGRYVSEAKALRDRDEKLFQQVFSGALPLTRAAREVKRREKTRALKQIAKQAARVATGTDRWKIINGDCIAELKKLPGASVNLIFADPPYNEGIDYGKGAKADLLAPDQFCAWVNEWLDECHRVLTADGSIFVMISGQYLADIEMILRGSEEVEPFYRRNVIAWVETFGNHTSHNFTNCWRPILYYTKSPDEFTWHGDQILIPSDRQTKYGDKRAADGGKVPTNVWTEFPRVVDNAAERMPGFPTQLPVKLVERIVLAASNPGDCVLDPFNGSGTTGEASLRNGRRYIGIEQSSKFAGAACARLRKVEMELNGD